MTAFFTFSDAIEHGVDFIGGTPDALAYRDARRSVLNAYREITNARTWSYLYSHGRVVTNAPYATGTFAYDQSGGTYEREVLLYGGTWPSWAGPGCKLQVGSVAHDVAERKSDTTITLTPQVNPEADIDLHRVAITGRTLATPIVITSVAHGLVTGNTVIVEGVKSTTLINPVVSANGTWVVTKLTADTFRLNSSTGAADTPWDSATGTWRRPPTTTFTLYQDDYPLPADFFRQDMALYEANFGGLTYADPSDQLWWQRYIGSAGTPQFFTVRGSIAFPGRLVMGLSPYPDQRKTIDFVYQRRSRELRWADYSAGTATIAANSTTLTGNGATFDPSMEGSIVRLGTTRDAPTSWVGANPPWFEAVVQEYLTATTLRLATAPLATFSAAKYSVSDPVDIEQGAVLTAFQRGVEKQLTITRRINQENVPSAASAYDQALREAQAADSRSYQGRSMGPGRSRSTQIKNMPATFT